MPRNSLIPAIVLDEIEIAPIRAQGAGGQHVNKVSSAVHLRFDVRASSLPELVKERLCSSKDQRVSKLGVVVIKAQQHRSQEMNRQDALGRLWDLLQAVAEPPRTRKPTRPSNASNKRRLAAKSRRGQIKTLRGKPSD